MLCEFLLYGKVIQLCVCVCVCVGFPGGSVVKNLKESACHCRRCEFDPWVGKIPWERKWQPPPVFLPGESHGTRRQAVYCLLLLLLSHFSRVRLFATPWTVAHQAPPSMGFSRQEYWSGLPCNFEGSLFKVIAEFGFSEIYL